MIADWLTNCVLQHDAIDGTRRNTKYHGKSCSRISTRIGSLLNDKCLVGYADDLADIMAAFNPEEGHQILDQVMAKVDIRLTEHDLQLAACKTEIVWLTRKRIDLVVPMRESMRSR